MYLGDCRLTECKPPSIQGEFPSISAGPLSKISSSNTVKVKSQKFHKLLLKLTLICSCFCHISFSSVSDSKGQRSVASSIPIFVVRNAENSNPLLLAVTGLLLIISVRWEHGHQPLWKILSKWEGAWMCCLFKGNHQPEEWDHTKSVWWLTVVKKERAQHPRWRGPNPVWEHGARSACWFGRMISLCFLFQERVRRPSSRLTCFNRLICLNHLVESSAWLTCGHI